MTGDTLDVSAFLLMSGDAFSPDDAERRAGVKLSDVERFGEIGKLGRYRGRPLPYGSARLDLSVDAGSTDLLPLDLEMFTMSGMISEFRACGASEIVLHINIGFSTQCNFEFSPELLLRLAALGVPVAVSCYELE